MPYFGVASTEPQLYNSVNTLETTELYTLKEYVNSVLIKPVLVFCFFFIKECISHLGANDGQAFPVNLQLLEWPNPNWRFLEIDVEVRKYNEELYFLKSFLILRFSSE